MKKYKKAIVSILCMSLIFGLLPYTLDKVPMVKAADYGISNPRVYNGMSTWDCIYFGSYWQNDTNSDGVADQNDDKEPIKWRVLSVNGNDALLLAEQGLDCQPYNTEHAKITWENCTLRTWLNKEFYNTAFTSAEREAIKTTLVKNYGYNDYGTNGGNNTNDKIYLLSTDEATNEIYGFSADKSVSDTRIIKNTAYAKERGASDISLDNGTNGDWWLRTPGIFRNEAASVRNNTGPISSSDVDYNLFSVRPVMHIDLSSSTWTKAETVNQKGEIGIEVTPNPALITPPPTTTPAPTPKRGQIAKPPLTPSITHSTVRPVVTSIPRQTTKPTKKVTPPAKVKKLKVKNKKKKSVTVTWKKVKGAKGYQIQYSVNKAFSKKKTKFSKKPKYTIKKLKKKKTYSFRVRAYVLNGKKKVYGKWSAVKRVKIKK